MLKNIFLDYASITPISKEVEKEMVRANKLFWGNPSSLHYFGEKAKTALEESRVVVAKIVHCRASEILFTSGGTESLNIAILGSVKSAKKFFSVPHVIVSSIEHPAVLEPIKHLLKEGEIEVSFVLPDKSGIIDPNSVKREIKDNTILVAVQHANNEIGTIQPVSKIGSVIKEFRKEKDSRYPYLLVDCCQSALYENVSLERLQADLLVFDGIKMYGPRGAGVLVVKHGVGLEPIFFGGGQEQGFRSGTENVMCAVGLAKAFEVATKMRESESKRLKKLRDFTIDKILKEIPGVYLNGDRENRLPNNINVCFDSTKTSQKIDSEFLVIKLDILGFAVSSASACNSLKLENGSYVIESLGKPECKNSSLRITLGRDTKKQDLDKLVSALKKIVK